MRKRSRSTLNSDHFSSLDAGNSPCKVSDGTGSLPTFLLLHLVSLVGQVALQQVVYLEVSVSAELCRRRVLKEEKTKKQSDTVSKKQRTQVRTKGFFPMGSSSSVPATANFWRMQSWGCMRSRAMFTSGIETDTYCWGFTGRAEVLELPCALKLPYWSWVLKRQRGGSEGWCPGHAYLPASGKHFPFTHDLLSHHCNLLQLLQ